MREWGNFLFFTSFFVLYLTASVYVVWRLCAGIPFCARYKYLLLATAFFMTAIATAAYALSKYDIDPYASYISGIGGVWMGIAGISFAVFFLNDAVNLLNLIFKIKSFRYYSTIISLIIAAIICFWSFINAAFILKIKEIKFQMPNLKSEKISITLLSDIHIDKQTSYASIQKLIEKVLSLNSDIIVITGDLLDIDIENSFKKYGLDKLNAPLGIYAVTGNHEYFSGVENYVNLCRKLGIKLLRNENAAVFSKEGEPVLTIVGINDKEGEKFNIDIVDLNAAFCGTDENMPIIFLSHRPEVFDKIAKKNIPILQLSGHTHAGQIPPVEIIRKFMKYNVGIYEKGSAKMYVTSGNCWWRVPMRTFNFGEIVKIVIEKE